MVNELLKLLREIDLKKNRKNILYYQNYGKHEKLQFRVNKFLYEITFDLDGKIIVTSLNSNGQYSDKKLSAREVRQLVNYIKSNRPEIEFV